MNYKKIIPLFSTLILVSCHFSQGVAAKPSPIKPNILPAQPTADILATPLSYKIESYDSQIIPGKRTYGVSLPPGYEQNPQQRYPVIFLLHGGHGEPTDWFSEKKGQAIKTLTKLYTTGKLPPSIIITPDGNDKRGSSPYWDPQYIDGPNGKVATAVGSELVKVVQTRYRTLSNPDFWAMGGLSSGGWGAINVGLHNWQNFSILFSHSGYFKDKSGPQNSPIVYIKNLPTSAKHKLRIYLDSGLSDTEELDDATEFSKVLNQEKVYNLFEQFPGSHTWQYWREHLADSLTFVGEQFRIAEIAHAADNIGVNRPKTPQNH